MSFNSYFFVTFFLLVLLARLTLGRTKKETAYLGILLGASLLFYAWHIPEYLIILIFVSLVSHSGGAVFSRRGPGTRGRKALLAVHLLLCFFPLLFYKYTDFLLLNLRSLLSVFGLQSPGPSSLNLILPIGISFYTFQAVSYLVDVYRGRLERVDRFWHLLLFISFFPQLVAGPIVRAREFLYQIGRGRRPAAVPALMGTYLMIRGFFFKLVVADNIAATVDRNWSLGAAPDGTAAFSLSLVYLFSCQIFADFAGYTDIARGAAYLLGFRLPLNFNAPYIAVSFSDFWRRWHMSLSNWFRDYLYIPLGGGRGSLGRTCFNLLAVMFLVGLWHGAAYTFVLWGLIHGLGLALERCFGLNRPDAGRPLLVRLLWFLLVQAMVLGAWIFFRSEGLHQGLVFFNSIFTHQYSIKPIKTLAWTFLLTAPVWLIHLRTWMNEKGLTPEPGIRERAFWCGLMFYAIMTCYGESAQFVYFQF